MQNSCPVSKISISCSKRPTWPPASFGLQKVCACMQTVATGVKFLSRMQAEAMQGTLDALQVCPHPTPFLPIPVLSIQILAVYPNPGSLFKFWLVTQANLTKRWLFTQVNLIKTLLSVQTLALYPSHSDQTLALHPWPLLSTPALVDHAHHKSQCPHPPSPPPSSQQGLASRQMLPFCWRLVAVCVIRMCLSHAYSMRF